MPPRTETRLEQWAARHNCIDFIRSRVEECGTEAALGAAVVRPWVVRNVRHLFNRHMGGLRRRQLAAGQEGMGLVQFARIVVRPCFYCGVVYSGGIDRIDSGHGYASDNIVPSCSACNMFKGAMHTGHFVCALRVLVRFWTLGVPSQGTYTFASSGSVRARFPKWVANLRSRVVCDLDEEAWTKLMRGACVYCGLAYAGGVDRVDPGGRYAVANCVSCCQVCNYLKGGRPVHVFRDFVHMLHARFAAHGSGWRDFTGTSRVIRCSWHIEKGEKAVRV
jgi:5-methylcytosine-specific restriction endonuclease McrA